MAAKLGPERTEKLEKTTTESSHPTKGSIIKCDDVSYIYCGPYHDPVLKKRKGDPVVTGCWVTDYDPEDDNYLMVRAVFLFEGKYYFIPSSYSGIGTLSPTREYTVIEPELEYPIKQLSKTICQKICPGFLD